MNSIRTNPSDRIQHTQAPRGQRQNPTRDAYVGSAEAPLQLIKPDPGLLNARGLSDKLKSQAQQARAGDSESIEAFFCAAKTVDGSVAESYAGIVGGWAEQDGPGFVDRLGQSSRDCLRPTLELVGYNNPGALIALSEGRPDGSGRPDGALAEAYAGTLSEMALKNPANFVEKLGEQSRQAWGPALAYVGYANPSALVGLAEGKPDGALAQSYAVVLADRAAADPAQFVRSMDGASRDSWRSALEMVRYANPSAFRGLSAVVDGAIAETYQQMQP